MFLLIHNYIKQLLIPILLFYALLVLSIVSKSYQTKIWKHIFYIFKLVKYFLVKKYFTNFIYEIVLGICNTKNYLQWKFLFSWNYLKLQYDNIIKINFVKTACTSDFLTFF